MNNHFYSFILILIFVFVRCCYTSYPNMVQNPLSCGRAGWKKVYVCDPDAILGPKEVEASQLDEVIKKIINETKCPCTNFVCTKEPGGYKVGVAIVKSVSGDDVISSLDDEDQYEPNLNRRKKNQMKLEEAGKFAHMIRNEWKLGRCDEDIIIVYSHKDKVIYTVTGDMASKVLTNKLITEITERVIPHGFHKGAFHGLFSILHDYRAVLLNVYTPRKPQTGSMISSSPPALATLTVPCFISYILLFCLATLHLL